MSKYEKALLLACEEIEETTGINKEKLMKMYIEEAKNQEKKDIKESVLEWLREIFK